jgi:hypothetical protein
MWYNSPSGCLFLRLPGLIVNAAVCRMRLLVNWLVGLTVADPEEQIIHELNRDKKAGYPGDRGTDWLIG